MFNKVTVIFLTVIFSLFTHGCVSKNSFEMMEGEANQLSMELKDLQDRHALLKDAKTSLNNEKETLEQEVVELKNKNDQLNLILAAQTESFTETISGLRLKIADQKEELDLQIKADEKKIDELGKKNNDFQRDVERLRSEVERLQQEKEQEVIEMSTTYEELLSKMKGEVDKGQITISELKGKLTVNMVDAILFNSGKAEVNNEGMLVLQKIVDILKDVTDRTIRIEGHTDNVKIGAVLAAKYPTNWELSSRRAVNVTRFLQAQGLSPENLSAVAYGEYKPVADNETDEGKAQNRRIEIVLAAKTR